MHRLLKVAFVAFSTITVVGLAAIVLFVVNHNSEGYTREITTSNDSK